jgi:hypothetical protein
MDIVGALSSELKLEENAAAGLAGGVLLLIEDIVRDKVDFDASSRIRLAVPEMRDWQMSSPTLAPGSVTLESLALSASHQAEGDLREFIGVLSRFQLEPAAVPQVAALMLQFLTSRLDPLALGIITGAMPLLMGKA